MYLSQLSDKCRTVRAAILRPFYPLVSFVVVVLGTASGCSSPSAETTASALSASYEAPEIYADHRAQQQLFSSTTGRIAYTDHGDGPALVLLHGVPTSSWMYRKVIPDLQQHFRTISVDLLGYGSSDKPDDDERVYTAQKQAERVQELLASLNINNYSIMMHDMGGLIAWELLRANPAQVENLIVQNTIIRDEGFKNPTVKPGVMARQMAKAYSSNLTSAGVMSMSFRNLGLTGDASLSEAECEGYVLPMREGGNYALYSFFTSLNDDLFARLETNPTSFNQFSGDTLVLWGAQDEVLTVEQLPALTDHLTIAPENLLIYPENNHYLIEEDPAEVVTQVVRFMRASS